MKHTLRALFALLAATSLLVPALAATASAATPTTSTHSWDPGLQATAGNASVHAWGSRSTAGYWGTGPVNYQAGATVTTLAGSSGTLSAVLGGTYCPNGHCSYGAGGGYKSLLQFWNDPSNFIAFGLIHDPGVSPTGTTLMIEGAANGRPVGGYWPSGAITGTSHQFSVSWTATGISLTIDHQVTVGPYPVTETHPSISFLGAGRGTGDIVDTTFSNIALDSGSGSGPISIPAGTPYLSYSATLTEGGTGTGYSAYINSHDASNNAISVGIQTDTKSPESNGQPYYIWELVQNGVFTYDYIAPAPAGSSQVTLKWWQGSDTAVFYADGTPIASFHAHLTPRLFFSAEGNARLNGDTVNDTITNTQVSVGNNCPTYCGLNGAWNTSFTFHGLHAADTNGVGQNGANFSVTGTVSGLAAGHDWDSDEVAGIAMIAQYWAGQ